MKPMIWHPEPNDKKVNQYLDRINHEPWIAIWTVLILFTGFCTLFFVLGSF